MGKKSKLKTKGKKQAKKALKAKGVRKPTLAQAGKIAKASEKTGLDIPSLAGSLVGGIPFVGGFAQELLGQVVPSGEIGAPMGRGIRGGLVIVDTKTGSQLRRISMEDYFYLKSLRNRRKIGGRRTGRKVAILRGDERVVKV